MLRNQLGDLKKARGTIAVVSAIQTTQTPMASNCAGGRAIFLAYSNQRCKAVHKYSAPPWYIGSSVHQKDLLYETDFSHTIDESVVAKARKGEI